MDLDIFTLADMSGELVAHFEEIEQTFWVSIAGGYLAIYESHEEMSKYRPLELYSLQQYKICIPGENHVASVPAADADPGFTSIQINGNRFNLVEAATDKTMFEFEAPSSLVCKEWINAFEESKKHAPRK